MRTVRRQRHSDDERLHLAPAAPTGRLRAQESAMLDLQRTAGNAAVCRMVGGGRDEAAAVRAEGEVEDQPDTGEPDWDAPIESEADTRTERAEGGPAPAAAPAAAPTTFPGYASMRGNATVRQEQWDAWKDTIRSTTATGRREQGFWIQWDASTVANATGSFRCVGHTTGPVVGAGTGATINLGTKPADTGGWYTVGSFHTHTPTKYRAVGRPVGPSSGDLTADTNDNVAGLVCDYVEARGGNIPAKWPLWSPHTIYHSGPRART
jgi:hypothetical protein